MALKIQRETSPLPNPEVDAMILQYFEIIRTSQNERYRCPLDVDKLGYYQVEENDDANSLLMRVAHGINEGECLIIFGLHSCTTRDPTYVTMVRLSAFALFLEGLKERGLSEAIDRLR